MLNRTLSVLLFAQILACALSLGFTPAVLVAFALMILAPVSFFRSMAAHGVAFLLLPCVVGLLAFQQLVLSPVFLGWIVLNIVASAICWNRASGSPQSWSPDSR